MEKLGRAEARWTAERLSAAAEGTRNTPRKAERDTTGSPPSPNEPSLQRWSPIILSTRCRHAETAADRLFLDVPPRRDARRSSFPRRPSTPRRSPIVFSSTCRHAETIAGRPFLETHPHRDGCRSSFPGGGHPRGRLPILFPWRRSPSETGGPISDGAAHDPRDGSRRATAQPLGGVGSGSAFLRGRRPFSKSVTIST